MSDAFENVWRDSAQMGFAKPRDFEDEGDVYSLVRIAMHPQRQLAMIVIQSEDDVHFSIVGVQSNGAVLGTGNGPFPRIETPRLTWKSADMTVAEAWQAQLDAVDENQLRPMNPALARVLLERVYALVRDRELAHPPSRASIEREGRTASADAETVEDAYQIVLDQWALCFADAALDNFRRASKMSASDWEDLEHRIDIVHPHLQAEDVENMLAEDDATEPIFQQCVDRGLTGVELYRAMNDLLPPHARRELIGEVRRPGRCLFFAPAEGATERKQAGSFVYEALDADGEPTQGTVLAYSSGEAKQQVAEMGLEQARIVIEPGPYDDELALDPAMAAAAVRASKESVGMGLLRAVIANVWIWGPPAAWVAWTLVQGRPFGWGDYFGFVYLLAALAVMVVLIAPMLLYTQALRSRVFGRWKSARTCLKWLQRINVFGAMPERQLVCELAMVTAASGHPEQALADWDALGGSMDEPEYLTGKVQILDYAGMQAERITCQRRLVELDSDNEMLRVDLAMVLAQHSSHVDEAAEIIGDIAPGSLSELALAGYMFTRGLVAKHRHQFQDALHHFRSAVDQVQGFATNPLVLSFSAFITGHAAVAMHNAGNRAQARKMWDKCSAAIVSQPDARQLVLEWQALMSRPSG